MDPAPFLGLSFTPIALNQRAVLQSFLKRYPQKLSDYTFASLFAWSEIYTHSWTFFDLDTLLVALHVEDHRHLLQPIGVFPAECQKLLLQQAGKLGYPLKIFGVDRLFLENHSSFCAHFEVKQVPEGSNYLYNTNDLATLEGRRYSKKRNLIAQAEASYHWQIERLCADHQTECCRMLQELGPQTLTLSLQDELKALRVMCQDLAALGPSGVLLRIDGQPAAFSIYDELNPTTAVIYFEKADRRYKGVYQLINRETAKLILKEGYPFINRETDLGHPGLRQAKLSYHPAELIEYFSLTWRR